MPNFLQSIGSAFLTGLIAISSLFSPAVAPQASLGATIPVSTAVFQTSLVSSIAATDTSMTLVNGTNSAGNLLSGYTCFNIDEGTSLEEFVCGTASGTAVTGLIRGIDPVDGHTQVTSLKKGHRRGASVKITDFPSIAILSRILNGDETLPNPINYTGSVTCSNSADICPKSYIDGIAIAGSPNASTTVKGISKLSVAPVSGTNPIAVGDNDPRVPTTAQVGFIPTSGQSAALPGDNTDIAVGSGNKYVTQTGLQKNAEKYAADTSGSSTAYVVTLSPVPTSLTAGMVVYAKIVSANTTTTPTLNVNSLGAKTIVKATSTALAVGDLGANSFNTFIYDGTNFVLQNPVAGSLTFTDGVTTKNSGDASTTQNIAHGLGRVPKFIRITATSTTSTSNNNVEAFTVYNGTTQASTSVYGNGNSLATAQTFTLNSTTASSGDQTGVVTFDATNIIITWTKTSAPTGTYNLMWEAEG